LQFLRESIGIVLFRPVARDWAEFGQFLGKQSAAGAQREGPSKSNSTQSDTDPFIGKAPRSRIESMAQPVTQETRKGNEMNGLWTAEFGSSTGRFGGGVAVLRDGNIMGGDGMYFYIGNYKFTGNTFEATIKVSPFIDGAESVFKTVGRDLTLELYGSLTGEGLVTAQGHPKDMPDFNIGVKLTKRS